MGFPAYFIYTPTGISATNVALTGHFYLVGRMCFVTIQVTFTGGITFTTMPSLPIPASTRELAFTNIGVSGGGGYYDSSVGSFPNTIYPTVLTSATVVTISKSTDASAMSASNPITWATGDVLGIIFSYEI